MKYKLCFLSLYPSRSSCVLSSWIYGTLKLSGPSSKADLKLVVKSRGTQGLLGSMETVVRTPVQLWPRY